MENRPLFVVLFRDISEKVLVDTGIQASIERNQHLAVPVVTGCLEEKRLKFLDTMHVFCQ